MKSEMNYAEFERLLAVYGSARSRWPAEARTAAAYLVARNGEARRLLAEAEALDRLLQRAPMPSLEREAALADRIVAAAQRTPRVIVSQPAVGPSPDARAPAAANVHSLPRLSLAARAARGPSHWRVGIGAALSAASLAAGIMLGLSNQPQSVLRSLQQLTGLSLGVGSATTGGTLGIESLDEDLL